MGYIDKDGYVFITGRLKDVIVTGSGLNVYPEEIELELGRVPAVAENCVLGRKVKKGVKKGMEEVIAIIIPNTEYFEKYGQEKGVKVNKDLIAKVLKEEIHKVNQGLPEYKKIADFIVRETEFSKTSTRKIKRYVLRKELGLL
jgi:long-chain acyl-CoA synthetase